MRVLAAALALLALVAGINRAAAQSALQCSGAQKPAAVAELMFGRKIGDRIAVTECRWARFVDREITPRFPDGLSVVDARGQWRDRERNRIVREPSKLVTIVLPGEPADTEPGCARLSRPTRIAFRQQSVGLIVRPACVSF